jgi:opacity protein-like surface antigen
MKAVVLFSALSVLLSSPAFADQNCKPVVGHFEAQVVLPPACTAPFCTAGRVWGGIQGTYTFAMTTIVASGAVPSIFFFTGQSQITTKSNELVFGTDTGTLDLGPNAGFASLITFTGGTGSMTGATGQIRLRGELGDGTSGDYIGTLCTP